LTGWAQFVESRGAVLEARVMQHIILTAIPTGIAILVGVPLGIWIWRNPRARSGVLSVTGVVQTIPSLALLTFLLPFLGIGYRPAIVALTLYALLPIVRNTYTGLAGIHPSTLEAADGVGFSRYQRLRIVEIPLALPVIVAGIRTAAVISVGIATLAAFIGAGGLGDFINRGLSLDNTRLVLLGAIPAAILALVIDAGIGILEEALRPGRKSSRLWVRLMTFTIVVLLLGDGLIWAARASRPAAPAPAGATSGVIRIGGKNFTEQFILGELMAQMIESHTHLKVVRKFDLGGTVICQQALLNGQIDMYPEYTGTALTTVLKKPVIPDPDQVYKMVQKDYEQRFGLEWLPPFGFNNTYALTVRDKSAQKYHWVTIDDLVPTAGSLKAGFTAEFLERKDGYPGLKRVYGLKFARTVDMDPAIMYHALAQGDVDVISAFSTDGRIQAYHLRVLKDDKGFFPPYQAAPVARISVLKAHPELKTALAPLSGILTDRIMRQLNYEVDQEKRSPAAVAHDFLLKRHLLQARVASNLRGTD